MTDIPTPIWPLDPNVAYGKEVSKTSDTHEHSAIPPKSWPAVAALATVAVPGLQVHSLCEPQRIDEDYQVCGIQDEQGQHWTVTVALRQSAGAALEAQLQVLLELSRADLGFEVAKPAGFARLKEGQVLVHRQLGGTPLNEEDLNTPYMITEIGHSLAALHAASPALISRSGMPVYTSEQVRQRYLTQLDEGATTGLLPAELYERWEGLLSDISLWRFNPTVIHGSLHHECVYARAGKVSALVDFAEAQVGDPARDFAGIWPLIDPELQNRLLKAYRDSGGGNGDSTLQTRIELTSELALLQWLLHGHHTATREIITDAQQMMADLLEELHQNEKMTDSTPSASNMENHPLTQADGGETLAGASDYADQVSLSTDLETSDSPAESEPANDSTEVIQVVFPRHN